MENLSEKQAEIVNLPIDIAIKVKAGPGSGKTRVLTKRIEYILNQHAKTSVVALTFTNKAALEIKNRLIDSFKEERIWCATIHSVAQRIFESYSHVLGLPANLSVYERPEDRREVFLKSLRDFGVDIDEYLDIKHPNEKERNEYVAKHLRRFSVIKREMYNEEDVKREYADTPNLWRVYEDYQQALLDSGGMEYDDIILYAYRLLTEHSWIGEIYHARFQHLCIDEAQDLNLLQYEFIKAFCGSQINSVLMVGDPDQAIFGFSGASKQYFDDFFVRDFSPREFQLVDNYRSSISVVDFARKLKPDSKMYEKYKYPGIAKIRSFDTENLEAEWIAETISKLLRLDDNRYIDGIEYEKSEIEGLINLEKMVVMGRTRFSFRVLTDVLKQNGIPFSYKSGSYYEPDSVLGKLLDYAIRVKLNPKAWIYTKKISGLLDVEIPPTDSENLLNYFSKKTNEQLHSEFLKTIEELCVEDPNIPKLIENTSEKLEKLDEKSRDEAEREIADLNQFLINWNEFCHQNLGTTLRSFFNVMAMGKLVRNEPGGLTLSTVHSMKGLEKDIVFVMMMCEGVFPDYRARTVEEIDQEKNTAFVAITRAKRWIFLTYPKTRETPWGTSKQKRSRFLGIIDR